MRASLAWREPAGRRERRSNNMGEWRVIGRGLVRVELIRFDIGRSMGRLVLVSWELGVAG